MADVLTAADLGAVPDTAGPAKPAAPGTVTADELGAVPEWTQGVVPGAEAFALGVANGPTLGLAGKAIAGLAPEESQKELAKARPVLNLVGEGTGILGASLLTGGGDAAAVGGVDAAGAAADTGRALLEARNLVPSNAIGAIAERLVPRAAEAGIGARALSGAARGAIEGGLFVGAPTAADAISSMAMGDPQHASEHILSEGGMNTLLAAGLGAALGGGIEGGAALTGLLKPAARSLASKAVGALEEQQGSVALDVLGVNKPGLRRLYGKGTMGLENIKRVTGVEGEDFPEVLGKILADPKAMVPNADTGALEPLIQGGDTAITVAEKIDMQRLAAAAKLENVYGLMDQVGPGIRRADLADTLRLEAERMRGDPTASGPRSLLRKMAESLEDSPSDTIKPTELWDLSKRNSQEIFNKSGLIKQNTDAELAFRDTIKEAIADYSKDIPALNRWPNTPTVPDAVARSLKDELEHANGLYQTWAELGKIADAGAESMQAGGKSVADMAGAALKGAARGATKGGLLGGVVAGAPGAAIGSGVGAVAGGGLRVAREMVSPQIASRTLEAMRGLSGTLDELAPKIHDAVRTVLPEAVGSMLDHLAGKSAELAGAAVEEHGALLPRNATWSDVRELDEKLGRIANGTTPIESMELRRVAPALDAATVQSVRKAAAALRLKLPANVTGATRGFAPPRAVEAANSYARGMLLGVKGTLHAIARGEGTAAMVAGARDTYPTMSKRADPLIADGFRKRNIDHVGRARVGLWLGSHDPEAVRVSRAVQQAAFATIPAAPSGPAHPAGGRQIGQSRINKISAPTLAATATEGTTRRLGKE